MVVTPIPGFFKAKQSLATEVGPLISFKTKVLIQLLICTKPLRASSVHGKRPHGSAHRWLCDGQQALGRQLQRQLLPLLSPWKCVLSSWHVYKSQSKTRDLWLSSRQVQEPVNHPYLHGWQRGAQAAEQSHPQGTSPGDWKWRQTAGKLGFNHLVFARPQWDIVRPGFHETMGLDRTEEPFRRTATSCTSRQAGRPFSLFLLHTMSV